VNDILVQDAHEAARLLVAGTNLGAGYRELVAHLLPDRGKLVAHLLPLGRKFGSRFASKLQKFLRERTDAFRQI